jgi:hypothetical protein
MRLKLNLKPVKWFEERLGLRPLAFTWDSDAGTVEGPDAAFVLERAANYAGSSCGVMLRVCPESRGVTDPLRIPAEMAILLGGEYELPPELEALYPVVDTADDVPEGMVY